MTRFFGKNNVALLIGFIMALSRASLVHGQSALDNFFFVGNGNCQSYSGSGLNQIVQENRNMPQDGSDQELQCAEFCLGRPSVGAGLFGFDYTTHSGRLGVFRYCRCFYEKEGVVTYPVALGGGGYVCFSVTEEFKIARSASASALGDPHFKTFNDIFFSYHGQCDLLLMWSSIHEVMIQIRTTRVDGRDRNSSFSYISEAALKIHDDILEVSSDGTLLINGKDSTDSMTPFVSGGSSLITKAVKGTKKHIVSYKVELGGGRAIDLRSNTKSSMVYIDVEGDFGEDIVGLLGSPGMEGLSSRDGIVYSMEFANSYSESFQVSSDEPMLFQEARSPQYPAGCTYTAATNAAASHLRRRLSDVTEVSKDEAMEACANAVPGEKMEFCVNDVMLTRDLDVAEDPSYSKNY